MFSDSLESIQLNKKTLVSTISPNSYGISTYNTIFKKALQNSDVLVLDGVYFGLGYFLKTGKTIKRNQGPFLTNYYLELANERNMKVFFVGSSIETLNKIKARIEKDYQQIKLGLYSPPYKDTFSHIDNENILKEINSFKPNILFVGMTCPKQEIWSFQMKDKIDCHLICNIGAVFDWLAGNQKQIHPIWWKLRLAWLKRTIDRPEIIKRYPNILIYFRDMIQDILKIKKIK